MAFPSLVTVVMPCFNAAKTVEMAVASARAQTHQPIEIVCIDDGSKDDTLAILRRLESADLRVIVCEKNGGVAAARNRGIAAATGDLVAFLDSDDSWAEDKIARQLSAINADPAMVMIGCRAEVLRLDGGRELVNATREPPQGAEAWRSMLHHSYLVPSVVMVRKAVARRIGGFNEAMRSAEEDQDFFIRLALEGTAGFVDAVLTTMHEQPSSLSSRNRLREYETVLPMVLRHCRKLADRLSPGERRAIVGARHTAIGRGVYLGMPLLGVRLLVHAIVNGDEPLTNLYYLFTASPWVRWLKTKLRHSASADTLART